MAQSPPTHEGLNIMVRRKGLGLSQKELAKLLGVKQVMISKWESGDRTPRYYLSICKLFDEYEVRFLDLVDDLISVAETEEILADRPEVAYPMYMDQEDYEKRCIYAKKLPCLSMYRQAVAWAAMSVREEGQTPYAELI